MPDTDLALLVDRFMRSIQFGLQKTAAEFDTARVGPGGGIILMTLADTGEVPLSALTTLVARDKSQMTRAIRNLEGKGLVARTPSPEDGRVSLVRLTLKGEGVVAELREGVAKVIDGLLDPISAAERATLKALLARVAGPQR